MHAAAERVRYVVYLNAGEPHVGESRSEVNEEPDIFGRASGAQVARVARRQLDGDDRLELAQDRVVANAGHLLPGGVVGQLEHRLEWKAGDRAEIVGIGKQAGP